VGSPCPLDNVGHGDVGLYCWCLLLLGRRTVLLSASTTSYRVPRTDRLPSSGSVGRTRSCRAVDGGRGRFLSSTTGRRLLPPSQDHSTASSCRRRRSVPGRSTRIVNRHPSLNCTATSVNHVDRVPTSIGAVGLLHNAVAVWAAQRRLLPSLVSLTSPSQLLDRWTTDVPGAVGPSESAAVWVAVQRSTQIAFSRRPVVVPRILSRL